MSDPRRLDWPTLGLAILIEGLLCVAAVFGGPHGALGGFPWMLQLPGILLVVLIPGEKGFFLKVAGMVVVQLAIWYVVIAAVRRHRAARAIVPLVLFSLMTGCARKPEASAAGGPVAASPRPFPRIGIAVIEESGGWCAEFMGDSTTPVIEAGQGATIVFPFREGATSLPARVAGPRSGECPAAFPQSRWIDYRAYGVELTGTPADTLRPPVALIVLGDAAWSRGPDGRPRADLDGDGVTEELRACVADEGEHFTIWSLPAAGPPVRRWHEYYDWGGITDPTCGPGEDGTPAT